jgi:hypothetical protein
MSECHTHNEKSRFVSYRLHFDSGQAQVLTESVALVSLHETANAIYTEIANALALTVRSVDVWIRVEITDT